MIFLHHNGDTENIPVIMTKDFLYLVFREWLCPEKNHWNKKKLMLSNIPEAERVFRK